eukprot:g19034.t1
MVRDAKYKIPRYLLGLDELMKPTPRRLSTGGRQSFRCSTKAMPEEIPGEADGFDVEAALSAFLADATMMELKLPALETEQRKKAKKLAEEYPEIKCESYGFGPERRLHLFKPNPANLKGKETDRSTVISGVTSPEDKNEPGSEEGAGVALSPNVYQVRNTFIHIEGSDVVDQRAVQSMPHGMFSQCLQDEVSALPGSVAGTTAERGQPTTTFLVDAPKDPTDSDCDRRSYQVSRFQWIAWNGAVPRC